MEQSHYLIVGASHAALSALHAIRLHDAEKDITIVTRDDSLPYSPTVLPYVVSGRSDPERVFLHDANYFARQKVNYRPRAQVKSLKKGAVRLTDGSEIGFEKLLLATGAAPALPSIPGLQDVRFHVLRTLDDALALRQALPSVKKALVLGGGLIGMHAAENLATGGAQVTVVEQERHILPGYFDADAASIIEKIFAAKGVRMLTGARIAGCAPRRTGCYATLGCGGVLEADLLLVATGVAPVTDFLDGSGVETDRGVLVDDTMRTSVENVWAAGDVAQARGFFAEGKIINGILPDAVDQGRIAGMAMAGDPQLAEYAGGVPLNTYTFFGQQAASIGVQEGALGEVGVEVHIEIAAKRSRYLKIVLRDDRLAGIFGINVAFDPGVMWELILRRVDLGAVKQTFFASPQQTARAIMSKSWR
jgi:phenylglyoxylate dehydrogenase epsilon subunit